MIERRIGLSLKGFGAPPGPAEAEVGLLSGGERLKRAAVAAGAFIAVAVIALPIPIVHFVLVPGGLLLAVVMGGLRLRDREVFRGVEGRCPFCGTAQQFALFGRYRLPRELNCANCHRRLNLTSERSHSPTESPTQRP